MTIDDSKKEIITMTLLTSPEYTNRNRLTCSGYKIYNYGLSNEYILVEARLRRFVQKQMKFFNAYEKEMLLSTQIRTVLNMVPFHFLLNLEKNYDITDPFRFYDRF